jgi:hypothetical protein
MTCFVGCVDGDPLGCIEGDRDGWFEGYKK